MIGALRKVLGAWQRFWFESFLPEKWRIFRAVMCSVMLVFYSFRQSELLDYFSRSKGLPIPDPSAFVPMDYRWNLFEVFSGTFLATDLGLTLAHAFYLVGLVLLILGIFPRAVSAVCLALHISFIHANVGAVYGADLIFTFFLFFFCLATERSAPDSAARWVSSAAMRMAQVQLCIIYAYSGLEKLKGPVWWKGEAIWNVIANPQLALFDFTWMSHFPLFLTVVAYLTLLWEVYFPVLIWLPRWRGPFLALGVLFHGSIGVMVKLIFFSLLMMSAYVLFLSDREIAFLRRLFHRVPIAGRFFRPLSIET